ncbi:NAD(P)/FAD-dependent oxidoreductase [Hyphomicrobium methylovorum]|uniref:NAD(P)/FAD-dependent oxidoreductase n=1 Tax=Hyphomicrobium methylovorum TaxID=84 RepID=UPI003CCD33AC
MTLNTHTHSYYAATANALEPFPVLEGTVTADVCVVGGGFSGVAAALLMAERGRSVVLVEADRIGSGASGRSGGQLIGGISGEAEIIRQLGPSGAKLVRDIRYIGHEIVDRWVTRYSIACDWKRGWMEVATRPRHMQALRTYVDERRREGDGADLKIVEPEEIGRVLGTSAYHGGYIDPSSGHLHPLNLCLGEARAAADIGVRIFERSRVLSLGGGARPWVQTERGRVEARIVILAGEIFDRFGKPKLSGLMLPTGSYIIATEPLSEGLATEINPQDLAVADSNVVVDYFRMSADRRMLFGGRCNYSNRDPKDIAGSIRPRMIQIFPQLRDAKIDFAWGGRIGIVINRVPAMGRLEPNLYHFGGYSGHGISASHIAASIVCDAISGTTERFDLFDRIRHRHLPFSGQFGNEMLALGMLYYRMRDLI